MPHEHSMWFDACHKIVRFESAQKLVGLPTRIESDGSATVLAHAFGEVDGALVDFKSEILQCRTVDDALSIANLLRELNLKMMAMEDLALKTADLLNGGSAA